MEDDDVVRGGLVLSKMSSFSFSFSNAGFSSPTRSPSAVWDAIGRTHARGAGSQELYSAQYDLGSRLIRGTDAKDGTNTYSGLQAATLSFKIKNKKYWETDSFNRAMTRCGVTAWNVHAPSSPHVVVVPPPSQWLNDGGDMPSSRLVAQLSVVQNRTVMTITISHVTPSLLISPCPRI